MPWESAVLVYVLLAGSTPHLAPSGYVAAETARRARQDQETREGRVTPFTPVALRMLGAGESVTVAVCDGEPVFDSPAGCQPAVTLRYTGTGFRRLTEAGKEDAGSRVELGRFVLALSVQGDRGRIQVHDPEAPSQKAFTGYAWYPPDPSYRFTVRIEPYEDQRTVKMMTTAGLIKSFRRHGRVRFEIDGQPQSLSVYLLEGFEATDPSAFFVPFRDATAGGETYPVGRYAHLEPGEEGELILDFNTAGNPNCAYNELWNCPIPPPENVLEVPIRAGELPYRGPDAPAGH